MSLRKTFEDSAVSSIAEILEDILPRDQRELDHEIARSTGESLGDIRRHGFSSLEPLPVEPDPEDLILDWDAVELARHASFAAVA